MKHTDKAADVKLIKKMINEHAKKEMPKHAMAAVRAHMKKGK